jgi:hypothetical protein
MRICNESIQIRAIGPPIYKAFSSASGRELVKGERMKRSVRFRLVLVLVLTQFEQGIALSQQWRFGVMADTQWTGTDDGRNPGSCSVDIVRELNQQFIDHNVKFVIQVGDLVDYTGSTATSVAHSEDIRAAFAQELYNAGIGFFPLRGNHDAHPLTIPEFKRIYPQTVNGLMNATPSDVFSVPTDAAQRFQPVKRRVFKVGTNFGTPEPSQTASQDWRGLSYFFDFSNARFILLDQFSPLKATQNRNPYPDAIDLQQTWIDRALRTKAPGTHAFVFSHKGLITENHADTLFGSDPSQDVAGQDAFITSLFNSGVRYYIHGHDHMHNRSLVSVTTGTPTDGMSAKVEDILCASDSSKFYTPGSPSNDDKYDVPAFSHKRQAQIAQELHTVGYYIFTIDGPRLTADYYSARLSNVAPASCTGSNCEWLISTTPKLHFAKSETFGYSLNGKEFQVCQVSQKDCNDSYTQVVDTYMNTTAKILSGANGSTAQDFDGRSLIKTVNTGWTDRARSVSEAYGSLASDILSIWGMAEIGTETTDTYTLSLTYDPWKRRTEHFGRGLFGIAVKDGSGDWINAVDMNRGVSKKRFVSGPWRASYTVGTYGVDRCSKTAWAVVNYDGDFAVAHFDR